MREWVNRWVLTWFACAASLWPRPSASAFNFLQTAPHPTNSININNNNNKLTREPHKVQVEWSGRLFVGPH